MKRLLIVDDDDVERYEGEDSERLVTKLEEKMAQLQVANQVLRLEVAEHKKAQQTLRENEDFLTRTASILRSVIDSTPDFVFVKDRDLRTILCNEACARALGKRPEELYGKTDIENGWTPELVKGDPARGIRGFEQDDRDVLSGKVVHNPCDLANVEGRIRVFDTLKIPFREANGDLIGVLGMARDITERKEAEEALRDSEARYRRIVDTANEGIWSVDENFITTFVNRRMARMLGYDESEMIGRPVHWFMFEADLVDLREKMRDRRTGISDRYERRYRHKDGRSVWVILSVTPLVDDKDGSFKGSFAMVTDISERKCMEEELSKSRHELELRVRERTAELERVNAQLRSIPSKLIAVQEDERKRIAGELHDSVGQTLAALKYAIETVLVKKDGGDLAGAFNLLERFVPTLQRSIDETRGIYMGLRPPMLDSLGLLTTLEWFCREFQSLHSSHHLELETKIKEEEIPDTVKITIFRIAQEALNNVAKHSRAGRVNLRLTKSRNSIELTVQDDGGGFELDSVLSHNGMKSLGLTGMRDRAKLGGGVFSIESTPGKGTVLRASWPT